VLRNSLKSPSSKTHPHLTHRQRDLGFKPHVYLIITKGGLLDGKWVEIECVPGDRLSNKLRNLLYKWLRE